MPAAKLSASARRAFADATAATAASRATATATPTKGGTSAARGRSSTPPQTQAFKALAPFRVLLQEIALGREFIEGALQRVVGPALLDHQQHAQHQRQGQWRAVQRLGRAGLGRLLRNGFELVEGFLDLLQFVAVTGTEVAPASGLGDGLQRGFVEVQARVDA